MVRKYKVDILKDGHVCTQLTAQEILDSGLMPVVEIEGIYRLARSVDDLERAARILLMRLVAGG